MVAVLAGGTSLAYYRWCQGSGGPQRPVSFTVPHGATDIETVDALNDQGVVRCGGTAARVMLGLRGDAPALESGEYQLTTNMTLDDALKVLEKGPPPVPVVDVTIPEGYRLTQ